MHKLVRIAALVGVTSTLILSGCVTQPALKADPNYLAQRLETLSADAMEGRGTGTRGAQKARDYIKTLLINDGITALVPGYEQPFDYQTEEGVAASGINLLTVTKGTSPAHKGTLIVTAHYDHVGIIDGNIYNGADDNATGVVGALAIAERLQKDQPQHDIVIAFLDAEEIGHFGAAALVNSLTQLGITCPVLNINLDMLGHNLKSELYVSGAYHNPALKPHLDTLASQTPVTLLQGHDSPEEGDDDWTDQSDHAAFFDAGIPHLYFGVEDHPDYHKPSDDFDTIPLDFYRRSVDTVELAVRHFDKVLDTLPVDCLKDKR